MDETAPPHHRKPKVLLLAGLSLCIIVFFGGGFIVWRVTAPKASQLPAQVVGQMRIPVYYPGQLPDGLELVAGSAKVVEDGVVTFTIANQSSHMVVTEQARPKLMEEVEKKAEFTTPIGNAYIATLNGRTTGFIVTDTTLIIISGVQNISTDKLRDIMELFTRYNT